MMIRFRRAAGALLALATTASVALVAPGGAAATVAPRTVPTAGSTVRYAVDQPICAVPKDPTVNRCFAIRRVPATRATPHAYAYAVPNYIGLGPSNGYTPDDIAHAYGVNPATPRSNQTVAIIDWYDDPNALADLNVFNKQYGLPAETATSFRKVNQNGTTSPLPRADTGSAGEIALDIESVRGMCHTCKIILIEANGPHDSDLAVAENRAVTMGATEISNSFGEPETAVPAGVLAAYNHPGVVITASTGDDGWYAWDDANADHGSSSNAAEFPSTSPTVVAVGGTNLQMDNGAVRLSEKVWNANGAEDVNGGPGPQGAGGGGCSAIYTAPAWQSSFAGYSAAGCNGKRLAADISADADPASGLDVYLTYTGNPADRGWQTIGGTSLAAPLVAAMYALAGGSHGAAYPAATLYANASVHPTSLFDVIAGGNGFCAGDTTLNCGTVVSNATHGAANNPNTLGYGLLDCSFPATGRVLATPPAFSSECNAVTGFDGPTGLGAPSSSALFAQTTPSVTITHTAVFALRKSLSFTAHATEAVAGTQPVRYAWNWGDGSTTATTSANTHHTFTAAGAHVITLTETDNRHAMVVVRLAASVGRAPTVHYVIPASAKVAKKATFSASAVALNTGAKIAGYSWKFGDGHPASGAKILHAYARKGTYSVTLTVTDTSGVSSVTTKKVRVS